MTRKGACQCKDVEADGRGCHCEWGDLLRRMREFAYSWTADTRAGQSVDLAAVLTAAVMRGRSLAIFELAEAGETHQTIAEELGVTRQRIGQLIKEAKE